MEHKYCIWCGNEIKLASKFCNHCGKKQVEEENQFVDWLIRHTKDKLKGDVDSTLFNAIKNFLLSHLYGTLMSIAIVTALGATVYASEPYINEFTADNAPEFITNIDRIPSSSSPTEMKLAVNRVCSAYMQRIPSDGERYRNGDLITVDDLITSPDFEYSGKYELNKENRYKTNDIYGTSSSYKTELDGGNFTLDISNQMYKDGYTVAECTAIEEINEVGTENIVLTREIVFSCVLLDDQWRIAETAIVSTKEYNTQTVVIDENKITLLIEDYVNAIFAGEDLSPYELQLPHSLTATVNHEAHTLPEECTDFNHIESIYISSSYVGSTLAASEEIEEMGYTVIGANIRITMAENVERRTTTTTHLFAFVDIDGTYYVLDDFIQVRNHGG